MLIVRVNEGDGDFSTSQAFFELMFELMKDTHSLQHYRALAGD